mmetsp:Transcript_708/g.977  ORF Transcript_708/g.977 Transcript_708/m.977 type:complete len:93 (-) Transcript_708:180-458(-)
MMGLLHGTSAWVASSQRNLVLDSDVAFWIWWVPNPYETLHPQNMLHQKVSSVCTLRQMELPSWIQSQTEKCGDLTLRHRLKNLDLLSQPSQL